MAEYVYDHGEHEHRSRSDISGELGKPSPIWLRWLGVATDRPAPPPTSLWGRRSGQGSRPTAPLNVMPPDAGGFQGPAPLASGTAPLPPYQSGDYQSGDLSFRTFYRDLRERRAEDERLTGRRWPGNSLLFPDNLNEALFFDQLAVAMGEVDPRLLARESALRYLRASRLPQEDHLAPTDVYAILYYGLGFVLRPLECTGTPQVLAVYTRRSHEIYLDWTLLQDPPYGRATLDRAAWRRVVDGSPLARILLAWCAASHLAENYDVPLVLGFSPAIAAPSGEVAFAPVGAADLLNRYRKTMLAFATLLAPQERLWRQIGALQLGIHLGDPEWRSHLRGGWFPRQADPVEQAIEVLAKLNNCPPSLIEWQLDGNAGMLDWDSWALQLRREVPALQRRYAAAAQSFFAGKSSPSPEGIGPATGRIPAPLLRLTF